VQKSEVSKQSKQRSFVIAKQVSAFVKEHNLPGHPILKSSGRKLTEKTSSLPKIEPTKKKPPQKRLFTAKPMYRHE
jgi:hypothetical protein